MLLCLLGHADALRVRHPSQSLNSCFLQCSAAQVTQFTDDGACLPEGPAPNSIVMCVDLEAEGMLATLNPGERLEVISHRSGLDNMLCVAEDNNPSKGNFFPTPTLEGTADEDDVLFAFGGEPRALPPIAAEKPAAYSAGDDVETERRISRGSSPGEDTWEEPYPSAFTLPLAGLGGLCTSEPVSFMHDEEQRSCAFKAPPSTVAPSSTWCGDVAVDNYVGNVRVGATPRGFLADAYVPVTLGSQHRYNTITGQLVEVELSAAETTSEPNADKTPDSCTCRWATKEVHYTVVYDSENTITSVTADVVTQHITDECDGHGFQQSFSLDFVPASTGTAERRRSGNPGYLVGKPILAGVLLRENDLLDDAAAETGKEAIAEYDNGLQLRGPADDGSCSGSLGSLLPVYFAQDTATTCTLTLTGAELAERCAASLAVAEIDFIGLPDDTTYVGAYGNADPNDGWAWLQVRRGESTSGPTCPNMITGFDVTITWGFTGEHSNPQPRIVAVQTDARVEYVPQAIEPTESVDLLFTTTITHRRVTEGLETEFVPPAPPLLPEVPNDLFFPFEVGGDNTATVSAASRGARPELPFVLAAATAAAALLSLRGER